MSDTDDTDVLLLIPPDFFHVHSDSEDSYYLKKGFFYKSHRGNVVDNILNQIDNLERRLNEIEVRNDFCSVTNCESDSTTIQISEMSSLNQGTNGKYYRNDNYLTSSTKSTPQKPRTKLVMGSLPNSPNEKFNSFLQSQKHENSRRKETSADADASSVQTTPDKKTNQQILGEIDKFLAHVKTIQNYNYHKSLTAKKPEEDLINLNDSPLKVSDLQSDAETSNRFHLEDINRLLEAVEMQQKFIESHDKTLKEENPTKMSTWKCGENENTVPNLGYGMKHMMYSRSLDTNPTKNDHEHGQKSDSASTSESTFHTVLEKHSSSQMIPQQANQNLSKLPSSQEKRLDDFSSMQKFEKQFLKRKNSQREQIQNDQKVTNASSQSTTQIFSSQPSNNSISSVNLYSLTDLWNANLDRIPNGKEVTQLIPKLEEEKCRRKQCERIIQDLQLKILEMQQRLAVAFQVDSAKDEAILRFHDAWEKIADRWKNLEADRNALSEELIETKEKSTSELTFATQKIAKYESEILKIKQLAEQNQAIRNVLEQEKVRLTAELEKLREDYNKTQENLQDVLGQREDLLEKIIQLESDSLESKNTILSTKNELTDCKNLLYKSEKDLSILREEYAKLEKKLDDSQRHIIDLEDQKKMLQQTLETFKKNEFSLKQELKSLQENASRTKSEMRNFYQHQVEQLVKDKLKEFQIQLEQAENALQHELQNKEQSIAKSAAKQIHKLSEKHRIELHLIEEKHKEETRLYTLQITQMKEKIKILQQKLESTQSKRAHLAKDLRDIMEAQWQQVVRIINNGKSPTKDASECTDDIQSVSEVKLGVSDTRIPVNNDAKGGGEPVLQRASQTEILQPGNSRTSFENTESLPRTKSEGLTQENMDDLQKYIRMLLQRLPDANPVPDKPKKSHHDLDGTYNDYMDNLPWYHTQFSGGKSCDIRASSSKENKNVKPPWK